MYSGPAYSAVSEKYRIRIPAAVRQLAESLPASDADRLLRQFLPDVRELTDVPGYMRDPLSEESPAIHPHPALVIKYPSKALYLLTSECPVFCRYCTRKRKTLLDEDTIDDPDGILPVLSSRPEVNEVILSGGDPVMLPDRKLFGILESLASLPRIRFIRMHTRGTTTLPERFTDSFWNAWRDFSGSFRGQLAVVTHTNLACEITPEAVAIWSRFRSLGTLLYNQSVLLADVNDDVSILTDLFEKLLRSGNQPYYLHLLDKVEGAAHFDVPDEKALQIFNALRSGLPAYMLPRMVRDSVSGKSNIAY